MKNYKDLQSRICTEKLPIYCGGSFEPFHLGHAALVQTLIQKFPDNAVILLPNYISPFKTNSKTPDRCWPNSEQKSQLMLAALHDLQLTLSTNTPSKNVPTDSPKLQLELFELSAAEGPSYTAKTIQHLLHQQSNTKAAFALGSDSFLSLPRWHNYPYLRDTCIFLVFNRAQESNPIAAKAKQPTPLSDNKDPDLQFVPIDFDFCISSSFVRNTIFKQGIEAVRGYLGANVYTYIQKEQLYTKI